MKKLHFLHIKNNIYLNKPGKIFIYSFFDDERSSTGTLYCGILEADRRREGLVVASLGWYFTIV